MPSLRVSAGGTVHLLSLDSLSTVRDAKAQLQALTGATPAQQRLIFKGRERKDDELLADAGLTDGAKVMLLFTPGFQRPPPAASEAAASPTAAAPAAEAAGSARPPKRVVHDEEEDADGNRLLNVVCLGVTHTVRVDPEASVGDVKLRMAGITGAGVDQQRLIIKGKERADGELLSAAPGSKCMVLFRQGFHLEAEGADAVRSMVSITLVLESRLNALLRRQKHRLVDGNELLALLGALEEDASAAALDLANARVKPVVEVQRRELRERVQRLLDTTSGMRKDIRF
ncbi:hypothetical protein T492DRAFT_1012062 [Pavlovales sp. CCMP2436]|nr:hypothetical protein T492DRAFT_1012062 [Pavlovales sp. CCMP2436]